MISILSLLLAVSIGRANEPEIYWGRETCVIYDYRPMIKRGEKAPYLFAIETKNHNGGVMEKTYDLKTGKAPKEVFLQVMKDISELMHNETCDRLQIFYPRKEKRNSDI